MDLQEDRVSLSGLGPEQIKRKLQHYKDSGGDSALLGHFILASSYWYKEYSKMKLYIPITLLVGVLIGFYIGSP
jgi:ABC-type enterobactin transport system permease subunit|tara:strand:- start:882 stop:1103 length:222 start_codon:yes stop_codon:yes gene_type:complete